MQLIICSGAVMLVKEALGCGRTVAAVNRGSQVLARLVMTAGLLELRFPLHIHQDRRDIREGVRRIAPPNAAAPRRRRSTPIRDDEAHCSDGLQRQRVQPVRRCRDLAL